MTRPSGPGAKIGLAPDDLPIPPMMKRTLRQNVEDLLTGDHLAIERARKFFAHYGELFEELGQSAVAKRLRGIRQLGIKRNPQREALLVQPGETLRLFTTPYIHDRWTHSESVAAHMIAACLHLGFSDEETTIAAFAALLHDVGHCAFSHDGETVLVKHGQPDHEARGERLIRHDSEIRGILERAGIPVEAVLEVIKERGRKGLLQKIMDTLSYIRLDAVIAGIKLDDQIGRTVVNSLRGVSDEALLVNDSEPIQQLLDVRAALFQELYKSAYNTLSASALRKLMDELVTRGQLTYEDLEKGTDQAVEEKFTQIFKADNLPTYLRSVNLLAHGFVEEAKHWETSSHRTREEAGERLHSYGPEQQATAFFLDTEDYLRKTMAVTLPDGTLKRLKTTKQLRPEDLIWTLYIFRG